MAYFLGFFFLSLLYFCVAALTFQVSLLVISDGVQFLVVASLGFSRFIMDQGLSNINMDHAPLFLLPLVAEILTVVFAPVTAHHACCRETFNFPEGSDVIQGCGVFLSQRPLSVFLIPVLTATLGSAQTESATE